MSDLNAKPAIVVIKARIIYPDGREEPIELTGTEVVPPQQEKEDGSNAY